MRKRNDATKARHLRTKLRIALDCLDRIGKMPDIANPERDADWKNCMKHASWDAREIARTLRSWK